MNRKLMPPAWLILLTAFVYSTLFFLSLRNPGNSLKSDSAGYLELAQNLRHRFAFSESTRAPWTPELFRLPGYPFFLALTHAEAFSFRLTVGLQCLMGLALLFLAWPRLYRLGGITGATLGAVFLCLDPVTVLHQNLILTEPLMALVLGAALCFSLDYFEQPAPGRALVCGLLFGAAALIKPIALFPAAVFVLCASRHWKSAGMIALITLILPLAWVARNEIETGRPVYTVQGGYALFLYPAANALAMDEHCTRLEAVQRMENSLLAEGFHPQKGSSSQSIVYEKKAIEVMKQHPIATLKIHIKGVMAILGGTGLEMILDLLRIPRPEAQNAFGSGAGTLALLERYPALIGVQLAYLIFLLGGYLLFARGEWILRRHGQWRFASFLSISVLLILMMSAHQGYYRFRLPLVPFLAFGVAASFIP